MQEQVGHLFRTGEETKVQKEGYTNALTYTRSEQKITGNSTKRKKQQICTRRIHPRVIHAVRKRSVYENLVYTGNIHVTVTHTEKRVNVHERETYTSHARTNDRVEKF